MSPMKLTALAVAAAISLPLAADAKTPQSLSAKVGGKAFESDDDGILYLMPTKRVMNLIASTKGASAYPPPKTPIDKLSIKCSGFENKPVKWVAKDFGSHGCEVSWTEAVSKVPFGEPGAEYRVKGGDKNMIEITSVNGKVIEGKFTLELVNEKTKAKLLITDGVFKAEDRQL